MHEFLAILKFRKISVLYYDQLTTMQWATS